MLTERFAPADTLKCRLAGEAVVLVELGLSIPWLPLKNKAEASSFPHGPQRRWCQTEVGPRNIISRPRPVSGKSIACDMCLLLKSKRLKITWFWWNLIALRCLGQMKAFAIVGAYFLRLSHLFPQNKNCKQLIF